MNVKNISHREKCKSIRKMGYQLILMLIIFNSILLTMSMYTKVEFLALIYSSATTILCIVFYTYRYKSFDDITFMIFEGVVVSLISFTLGLLAIVSNISSLERSNKEIAILILINYFLAYYLAKVKISKKSIINNTKKNKSGTDNKKLIILASTFGIILTRLIINKMSYNFKGVLMVTIFMLLSFIFGISGFAALLNYKKNFKVRDK